MSDGTGEGREQKEARKKLWSGGEEEERARGGDSDVWGRGVQIWRWTR